MKVLILSDNEETHLQIQKICKRREWEAGPYRNSLNFLVDDVPKFDALVFDFNHAGPQLYWFLGCITMLSGKTPALIGICDDAQNVPDVVCETVYTLENWKDLERVLETVSMSPKCTPGEAMASWAAGGH